MGTFRDVSKSEPCPICGKTDWCTILRPTTEAYPGQELYVCRRIQQGNVYSNGQAFTYIKELADGSSLYTLEKSGVNNARPNKPIHYVCKERPKYPKLKEPEILDSIYRSFLQLLPVSSRHIRKLKNDGWPEDLIRKSLIRSISFKKSYDKDRDFYTDSIQRVELTKKLFSMYGPLNGVPGFYQDSNGDWTFTGRSGMLIPVYDLRGNLYRLRLRLDRPDVDENGKERNKYKNFSSFHSAGDTGSNANTYRHGSRAGSCIGLYYSPGIDISSTCYITEGEKKAIFANYALKSPVISLPGTGTYKKMYTEYGGQNALTFLRDIGCATVVVAYDADKAFNVQVRRYEQKLVSLLRNEGFSVFTAEWNIGFGKGLDDVLSQGVLPLLQKPV